MKVTPVAMTQSLVSTEDKRRLLTPEEHLVYVARVSNPSNQMNTETSDRLVAYLLKNKHISPFEQVDMTFEIVTSRAIAAQILRHWSARFQEFSQRYAEAVEFEPIEIRMAPEAGQTRQGSGDVFDPTIPWFDPAARLDSDSPSVAKVSEAIKEYLNMGKGLYKTMLEAGVAKETARMILPLTTQTTMYMKGDLRTWIFYLKQRTDLHAQKEHRQLAHIIQYYISTFFPMVTLGLLKSGIWDHTQWLYREQDADGYFGNNFTSNFPTYE